MDVLRIYLRNVELDVQHETNTKKIIARLLREGWVSVGGGRHDKFKKPGHDTVPVPRHSSVSPGVALSIARAAGWTGKGK